jgi:hypothetical protein
MDDAHEPQSEHSSPYLHLPWPALAAILVAVLGLLLAAGIYANRNLRPQVGLVPTQTAIAVPTQAVSTSVPTAVPRPTALPIVAPTPNTSPAVTQIPTMTSSALSATTSTPAAAATVRPTVIPQLEAEVGAAYTHYWEVRAQALFDLDTSRLSTVMAGDHLKAVETRIEKLRSDGQAIQTEVEHNYVVVDASSEDAEVADSYLDHSVYIDAQTHVPISSATGLRLNELYRLNKHTGSWRVVDLERSS